MQAAHIGGTLERGVGEVIGPLPQIVLKKFSAALL
jgi:hypothetical protein